MVKGRMKFEVFRAVGCCVGEGFIKLFMRLIAIFQRPPNYL